MHIINIIEASKLDIEEKSDVHKKAIWYLLNVYLNCTTEETFHIGLLRIYTYDSFVYKFINKMLRDPNNCE